MTRTLNRRGLRLFVAGLLVAGIWAAQAAAQPGGTPKPAPATKADLKKAAVEVKFAQAEVKVVKRAAVTHKAWDLKCPKTGKAVPTTEMLTLPNGKKVKAGEYYTQLNKLEKDLNAVGHSLRADGDKVLLQKTTVNATQLDSSAKTLAAKHLALTKTMKAFSKREVMEANHKAALKKDALRMAPMAKVAVSKGAPKTAHRVQTWNYSLGKKSVVAAYLDGKLEVTGKPDVVEVLGEAGAGGWLANHQVRLLQARGSVRAPEKGTSTARLNVYVMGQSVHALNHSVQTPWSKSDAVTKTFDYSTKFRFSIGPIPVSAKLGVQGSAGARYFVGLRPLHAEAQIIPSVHAKAYAQLGVDIVVASAGVGGQLRLMDLELRLGASLGVHNDAAKGPYVSEHVYAHSDLKMLSGSLYFYVEVTVPRFGIPPWKKKQYTWDIWKWGGFNKQGYLFNIHNKTYLYPSYKATS